MSELILLVSLFLFWLYLLLLYSNFVTRNKKRDEMLGTMAVGSSHSDDECLLEMYGM